MLKIKYKTNIPKKIISLSKFDDVLAQSKRYGLSYSGYFLMDKVREHIENEGNGLWPSVHPLTLAYSKKYRKGGGWRKGNGESPFFWLGKFARYVISRNNSKLNIGFGNFKQRAVKKGKDISLNRGLGNIATKVQKGSKIRVSNKMRKLFGSTRKSISDIPGKDFFPLRRNTRILNVPPRPIMKPVFDSNKRHCVNLFFNKFHMKLSSEFNRL